MSPTLDKVYADAVPHSAGTIQFDEALWRAAEGADARLDAQADAAERRRPLCPPGQLDAKVPRTFFKGAGAGLRHERAQERLPDRLLIFIPFLVIDMIVASVLIGLGDDAVPVLVACPSS